MKARTAGPPLWMTSMDMPVDFRSFDVPALERRAQSDGFRGPSLASPNGDRVPFFVRVARPDKARRTSSAGPLPAEPLADEPLADEPIGREAYEEVVAVVRERVAREVPSLPDFGVTMLDGGAVGGPVGDAERTFGKSSVATRTFARYLAGTRTSGGFTTFVSAGNGRYVCATTGGPPSLTMYHIVGPSYPGPMDFGAATAREFQTWIHWHEVGHCLLGSSELRADTFGLLMAIQSGVSKDMVRSVAAFRESAEFTSPYRLDDYVVSPASGWIAARYDAFAADREFRRLDVVGVARLATALADRLMPTAREVSERGAVRASLVAALAGPDGGGDGRRTGVGGPHWLYVHAKDVAVFARLMDVHARLSQGPRDPTQFAWDYGLYRSQVHGLAAAGDPTAASMEAVLDRREEAQTRPAMRSPYGFAPARAMAERFMPTGQASDASRRMRTAGTVTLAGSRGLGEERRDRPSRSEREVVEAR